MHISTHTTHTHTHAHTHAQTPRDPPHAQALKFRSEREHHELLASRAACTQLQQDVRTGGAALAQLEAELLAGEAAMAAQAEEGTRAVQAEQAEVAAARAACAELQQEVRAGRAALAAQAEEAAREARAGREEVEGARAQQVGAGARPRGCVGGSCGVRVGVPALLLRLSLPAPPWPPPPLSPPLCTHLHSHCCPFYVLLCAGDHARWPAGRAVCVERQSGRAAAAGVWVGLPWVEPSHGQTCPASIPWAEGALRKVGFVLASPPYLLERLPLAAGERGQAQAQAFRP